VAKQNVFFKPSNEVVKKQATPVNFHHKMLGDGITSARGLQLVSQVCHFCRFCFVARRRWCAIRMQTVPSRLVRCSCCLLPTRVTCLASMLRNECPPLPNEDSPSELNVDRSRSWRAADGHPL